jgi:hypothetical protein
MKIRITLLVVVAFMLMFLAGGSSADVPAPPVNQDIGMKDIPFDALPEADCLVCHTDGIPAEGTHHLTPVAQDNRCFACHGDSVNLFPGYCSDGSGLYVGSCSVTSTTPCNSDADCIVGETCVVTLTNTCTTDADCPGATNICGDGHIIPTYDPSLVTPRLSVGYGLPLNSRGEGAGSCNYCHDDDGGESPTILSNALLHHNTDFGTDVTKCEWCHAFDSSDHEQIRVCERCHGYESLHNIQADSPNPNIPAALPDLPANIGYVIVGIEDAGYGHVGRDAGLGDSDCWGCHGSAFPSVPDPGDDPVLYHLTYGDQTEADCRFCHGSYDTNINVKGYCSEAGTVCFVDSDCTGGTDVCVDLRPPDRHHLLYDQFIRAGSAIPNPDSNFDSIPDTKYVCLSCHRDNPATPIVDFDVIRDCRFCHQTVIDADGDGSPSAEDCDDNDANNYPGNTEVCDGQDNDCNGLDDVLGFVGSETDNDSDGLSECQNDCDDADAAVNPGASEVCNSIDDNCNDIVDEGDRDGDEIDDCVDSCPDEDATGFDANSDGCIDNLSGLMGFLETLVSEGVIAEELRNSLMSKVENAERSADRENICVAINKLEALINEVNAQRGKKISEDAANEVIAYAESVIAHFLSRLPAGDTC